jgi:hypothetical protein
LIFAVAGPKNTKTQTFEFGSKFSWVEIPARGHTLVKMCAHGLAAWLVGQRVVVQHHVPCILQVSHLKGLKLNDMKIYIYIFLSIYI